MVVYFTKRLNTANIPVFHKIMYPVPTHLWCGGIFINTSTTPWFGIHSSVFSWFKSYLPYRSFRE